MIDMARLCTSIAIHFPETGAWDVLVGFLCDIDAYPAPKRLACKILSGNPTKLPGKYRDRLERALWALIDDKRPDPTLSLYTEIGGAFEELLLVLLPTSHPNRKALEGTLLAGGQMARCDAADYYSMRSDSEPLLLALARDANHEVAGRAVFGLARLASQSEEVDGSYIHALAVLAQADGDGNAHRVLSGLEMGTLRAEFIGLVSALREHPSASVRLRANDIIESAESPQDGPEN